jgi:hypothetical protein
MIVIQTYQPGKLPGARRAGAPPPDEGRRPSYETLATWPLRPPAVPATHAIP